MEARDHVYVCIRECVFVHVLGILGMSHGRRDASGTQLLALPESGEQMELCRGRQSTALTSFCGLLLSVTPVKVG